jgi:hypothetical protein
MSPLSLRMCRWSFILLILLSLFLAPLPIPMARAADIRYIHPVVASTASIIRVLPTGSTTWPCGDNWGATCTLQTALTNAAPGDEIWVATGVYTPGLAITATFRLTNDVGVYGGFALTETLRNQRDPATNITVLSGDIDGNDLTDPHGVITTTAHLSGTNAYHIVTGSGVTTTAVLDGLTVTGGRANGANPHDRGGGMINFGGSPTLINVTFSGNSASYYGGGMFNFGGTPPLTNVTFSGNSASSGAGGGMYNDRGSPTLTNVTFSENSASLGCGMYNSGASPTLTDVTFSGNWVASSNGCGMYNVSSSPVLTNVSFSNNLAEYGGGMYNSSDSSPALTNVSFSNNWAQAGGGMYNITDSNPTLTNVTFSGNAASDFGGGLSNINGSSPALTNVTFSGNTAVEGGGMYNLASSPTLTNVTFSGNMASDYGGGMYNRNISPTLTNVTFSGNMAYYYGGGMYNLHSSPTLTNVTFSGNSAAYHGGGMENSYSSPTIRNTILWGNTALYFAQVSNETSMPVISESVVQDGCPLNSTCSNIITADPRLSTLGNYGGPAAGSGQATLTMALLPGSSAIAATSTNCPATDQRGVPRGTTCSIGTYEARGFSLIKASGDHQHATINTAFSAPLVISVTSAYSEPVNGGQVILAAPSAGASVSGTMPLKLTIANGAVSQAIAANGTAGTYTVTASTSGAASAVFNLMNSLPPVYLPLIIK